MSYFTLFITLDIIKKGFNRMIEKFLLPETETIYDSLMFYRYNSYLYQLTTLKNFISKKTSERATKAARTYHCFPGKIWRLKSKIIRRTF